MRPPDRTGDDGTSPFAFDSIQAALDAAGESPTTVCVGAGLYRERLVVPAGVHLLGRGQASVRIRPPNVEAIPHPVFVDQVLVTMEPSADRAVRVEGMDIGGAAICADAVGAGTSTLADVRLADCGVGLRASAGTAVLQNSIVADHYYWGVHASDLDALLLDGGMEIVRNGAAARPAEERPTFSGSWERASELDDITGGGAVRVFGSGLLLVEDTTLHSNWHTDGVVVAETTDWTVRGSVFDLRAIVAEGGDSLAGNGPGIHSTGSTGLLSEVYARTDGQSLVQTADQPADVTALSVAWDGRGSSSAMPDRAHPAVSMPGGGTLVGYHLTLLGPFDVAPLQFGADTWLDVANSLAWVHGDGHGLAIDGGELDGPGVRYSLFEDGTIAGEGMIPPADPDLRDAPNPWTPTADSPLRCGGSPEFTSDPDLHGDPRPFAAGKAPDIGAVERQEPCP